MDGPQGEALALLDEIQGLLEDMYALAERAARDGCGDGERQVLQERLCALRGLLDDAADRVLFLERKSTKKNFNSL